MRACMHVHARVCVRVAYVCILRSMGTDMIPLIRPCGCKGLCALLAQSLNLVTVILSVAIVAIDRDIDRDLSLA